MFCIPLCFQPPVILSANIPQRKDVLALLLPWDSSWGLVALAGSGIVLEMWEDLCLFSHFVTAVQHLPLRWNFLFKFSLYYSRFTEHSEWKLLPGAQETCKAKLFYIADAWWDHQQKWGMSPLCLNILFRKLSVARVYYKASTACTFGNLLHSPFLLHVNWKELGNAANDGICTEKHSGKLLLMHALQMSVGIW